VFYILWSAKWKSNVGKTLNATCKVHINCRPWLDLWFVIFATKFECEMSSIFSPSLRGLLLFYLPCFKCIFLEMHHACNVFCEVRVWAWFEVWTMNTFCEVWTCEVKSFLVNVIISKAFFHKFWCIICLILGCLQCKPKPFVGNSYNFKGLLFYKSFYLQCLILHYFDSRSYILLGNSYNLRILLFCFIYIWTNTLFCFSNFLLSIFINLTNLLLHSSKKFNNLLL
jgi:hypothetical protein